MTTFLSLIIKSYITILLSVGLGSLLLLSLGLYFIFRSNYFFAKSTNPSSNKTTNLIIGAQTLSTIENKEKHEDISAIAGEDLYSTQLDLARAYLETGKTQLAQDILKVVIANGTSTQQMEAHNLLRSL